ncbi:T9SS sorting signal type C domain-containing protein [Flavobacterium sangjuense]|uniref:Uncharacterized protein n=1 Tax=Flavobacterium sangjuense TaxID=2518177 RepID=A0A4P7PS09_9FLAO|nr:T9SS sorting signal type C domain-containing protein [Flavobacterium sangjuense]QBZ96593.1 hypothetical protein GS03_00066 [Flavobacterium sangjuense]
MNKTITLSKTCGKTTRTTLAKSLLVFVLFFGLQGIYGQISSTTTGGLWNVGGTWVGGVVPTSADNVIIRGGATVTVNVNTAACSSIQVNPNDNNSTGTLTFNASSILTVSGNVTFTGNSNKNAALNMTSGGILKIGGSCTISTTSNYTFTSGTGTIEYNAAGTQTVATTTSMGAAYHNLTLSNSGSKTTTGVTVNGILSMEGTATASAAPTYGSAATLQYNTATARTISGTTNAGIEWITPFVATGGVVIANTGKITMGIARVINSGSNITVNSGASFDAGSFIHTINGGASLVVNGTLDFSNASGEIRSGTTGTSTLTMGSAGLIKTIDANGLGPVASASFSTQSGGAWTTTSINTNGTIEYYRTTDNTQIVTDRSYNNLTITGTQTKTWTLGAARTVAGNISVGGLTMSGTFTVNVGGNWTNNGGTFTKGTETFNFNGTTQSIGGSTSTTFNNVTLSNSGTKTFNVATTFGNNLSIASGVIANLSTFTHTDSGTLTLGGSGTPSGSHGSTSSSATYKNNTYFAATSGIINVTSGSCPAVTAVLSGTNTICFGSSSNLIVTITGGVSPYTVVYSGGTVNSYTSGSNISVSPGSTTNYTLTSVTESNGCTASVSGSPTVTVDATSVGGSITGGSTPICQGTNTGTMTLSGHTGSVVKWQKQVNGGGYSDIVNTATTYSEVPSSAGTWDYRAVVQNGTCTSVNSAIRTIVVDASNGGSITGGSTPMCEGSNTGTMTLSGYTGSVVKWQKQVNGGGYSDIVNTATTYSEVPSSAGTWDYRAVVQNGSCTSVNSAIRTIVIDATSVGGSVTGGSTPICEGSNTGTMTLSGHTGSVVKWQKQVNGGGYSDIVNTATTYSEVPSSAGTWDYRAVVQNGTCTSVNSAIRTIVVDATSVGGSVTGGSTPICEGSNTGTMTLSGHTGSVVKWQKQVNGGGYSDIVNTATTYSEVPSSAGTWDYRAVVQNGTCTSVNSAIRTIVVDATSVGGSVTGGSTPICEGSNTGTMTLSGHTGSVVKWQKQVNGGGYSDIVNTATTYSEVPSSAGTWDYRAVVQNGSCTVIDSAIRTIVVDATSVGGSITGGSTPICEGSNTGTMTLSGHTGSVVKWQKQVNGGGYSDIVNTAATYSEVPSSAGTWVYRAIVQNDSCTLVSSAIRTIVVDATSVGGSVTGGLTPICEGSNTGTMTLSGHTGSVVKWQKQVNGGGYSDIVNTATTYSEVPSSAGTWDYRAVVQNGTCTSVNSAIRTIVVDATSVGGSVTGGSTPICEGSNTGTMTLSGHTGSVVKWQKQVNGGGYSDIVNTATTYSEVPSSAGTWDYRAVVQNGTCTSVNSAITTIVVEASVGGSVSGTANICSGSTSGLLTLSGETGTVVRWEYSVSPFSSWTTIVNTTNTHTSGALTQTTHFRAVVQYGSCAEANSSPAVITITTTTTTDGGTTWDNGSPSSTKAVVYDGSTGTVSSDIAGCSLVLTNNATVTVSSGVDVTLSGAITVNTGSTFTLNNNANLIQSGTTNTNSGNIIVKRDSSALKRLDYTLWSSPVSGQNLFDFSPLTSVSPNIRFYTYNSTINFPATTGFYEPVTAYATTDFALGKGYLIRMPFNHPTAPAIWNGQFTGIPHNGTQSVTITHTGDRFNAIGNPYPSPIDAVAFVSDSNNTSSITGTLYFWRKTNNALSPSYCTWTMGGFVGNGEAQVFDPNDIIQTGQGFFVEGTGSGAVNFDNTMRVGNNDNQFFKTSDTPSTNSIERNRIWLNATNSSGLFSQTMVGYITNATQGVDTTIDGKYINDGAIALSSLINEVPYAIQGRSLPFDANDIVPLNFKVTTAGNYTIAIDHVDGLFTDGTQSIYLKDNLTTTIHNLNAGAYSFASESGTFADRFEIIYALPLGTENPIFTANSVVIYNHNNEFVVNTGNIIMASIKVFDIQGRLLQERKEINSNQTKIGKGLANQVLLVQITSEDGVVVTKKVIQ